MVSAVLVEEVTRLPRRSSLSIQVSEVWLGGRDSNPDTVVQRAVPGIPVGFDPLRFVPSLSTTTSVGFGLFRCAPVQIVSMCLTRRGSQPVSLSGHGFKPALGLAFQSC